MSKSYKSFIKEYSMGLQVPATSFLKPVGSMNLQAKKKLKEVVHKYMTGHGLTLGGKKHMPKDSGGKIDLDEPTRKNSSLKKAKKVDSKPKDDSDATQPSTKYKGLAPGFNQDVPNYIDG
jgi:hypothetical protein